MASPRPKTCHCRAKVGARFPTSLPSVLLPGLLSLRPVDNLVLVTGGQGTGQREAGPVPTGQFPLPNIAPVRGLLSWLHPPASGTSAGKAHDN